MVLVRKQKKLSLLPLSLLSGVVPESACQGFVHSNQAAQQHSYPHSTHNIFLNFPRDQYRKQEKQLQKAAAVSAAAVAAGSTAGLIGLAQAQTNMLVQHHQQQQQQQQQAAAAKAAAEAAANGQLTASALAYGGGNGGNGGGGCRNGAATAADYGGWFVCSFGRMPLLTFGRLTNSLLLLLPSTHSSSFRFYSSMPTAAMGRTPTMANVSAGGYPANAMQAMSPYGAAMGQFGQMIGRLDEWGDGIFPQIHF